MNLKRSAGFMAMGVSSEAKQRREIIFSGCLK
jgi:hypothetical protein